MGDFRRIEVQNLVEVYIGGLSEATLVTYGAAYKRLVVRAKLLQCSVFKWKDGEVMGLLMDMSLRETSENAIKLACAVINLLFEVMGIQSPTKSSMLLKVKKSLIKTANSKKKLAPERHFMKLEYLKLFITEFYKNPAASVEPSRRRFFVQQVLLFMGTKRFNDIKDLKWGDFVTKDDGSVQVFVAKSKTDQEARGTFFYLSGKKKGILSIPEMLRWYTESLGLKKSDFMFPRFRRNKDTIVPMKNRSVGYGTALKQLKEECKKLHLPILTMHSGRIGSATVAAQFGIAREIIKEGGGWKSDAVDVYIRTERPGVVISDKFLECL